MNHKKISKEKIKTIRALEWGLNLLTIESQHLGISDKRKEFINTRQELDTYQKYNKLLNILIYEYENSLQKK